MSLKQFSWCLFCVCALWLCTACGDDAPSDPSGNTAVDSLPRGVYILCEGLWKMDNSTLTRYNPATGAVENNFFSKANPGLRVGDTGNDIVLRGDTVYIAVTTSRTVEMFRASTGKWLNRVRFDDARMPRCLAFAPDGLYVSNYTDNSVSRLDPHTLSPLGNAIPCGPAVEGLVYAGTAVFAANSGLGSLQLDSPKAGTLAVIRAGASVPEQFMASVPNVVELRASPDGAILYAFSQEITSRPDIKPAIVEYNAVTLQEIRRWVVEAAQSPCLSAQGDSLFFISKHGVDVLDMRASGAVPVTIVHKDRASDNWYSLALHPTDGTLWIGNARGYTTEGEVIVANKNGAYVRRFDVGVNPTGFVFFGY